MRPPEEVKRDLVRQWLAKAEEDLKAAQILLGAGTFFYSSIGFHCQQAAEKYFKAYLTEQQIEFPKTHDLGLLLDLISAADSSLAESLNEAATLNPYGVEMRYPGDFPEITREDATEAVQLAERARGAILTVLEESLAEIGRSQVQLGNEGK